MARFFLTILLASTPMIMTSMDFNNNEMGIMRNQGFMPASCPTGYVLCLETLDCVPEDEPLTDDCADDECPSTNEPYHSAVICNADEIYCMEHKRCIPRTTNPPVDEQPPVGCSKTGAASKKHASAMQQPVVACSADQVYCASERVCVEMNDYNPFTLPQAQTTTGTSGAFTTGSSISPVQDTTTTSAPTQTEIHTAAPSETPVSTTAQSATARSTVIPAVVKEEVSKEYHEFKQSMNEIGSWWKQMMGR